MPLRPLLSRLPDWIMGSQARASLEGRIFTLITLLTSFVLVVGIVSNFIVGIEPVASVAAGIALLLISGIAIHARRHQDYRRSSLLLLVVVLFLLPLGWVTNAGFDGNMISLMIVLLISLTAIVPPETRSSVLVGMLILTAGLILLQYFLPTTIVGYENQQQRLVDLLIGNLLYMSTAFLIMLAVIRSYTEEYQKSERLHKDLTASNEALVWQSQQLRDSEERFRTIVTTTTEGFLILGLESEITDANDSYCRLGGYQREDLIGKRLAELIAPEEQGRFLEHLANVVSGSRELFEFRQRSRSGDLLDLEISASPIAGEKVELVGFIRDMTLRKRQDEQKRQAQKIEALGTLAGGIAHDFNNLLFGILANTELLEDEFAPGTEQRECLQQIMQAGERAKDLVAQILAFSRKTESVYQPLDLSDSLHESLRLLRGGIPRSVDIRADIPNTAYDVLGDRTEIHQVLMNLCANAAQAMEPQAGVIDVSLRLVELPGNAHPRANLDPGRYLQLVVRDNGPGIPPAILPRIFDPYFTTKDVGRGTGLGLALVLGIVSRMRGQIIVDSNPGEGACFTMLFPAVSAGLVSSVQSAAIPLRFDLRVLVVDDEEANLLVMERILHRFGCEVGLASSAEDALARVSELPGHFDLVITDQSMPRVTGMRLAQILHESVSPIPVILYTGFGDIGDQSALRDAGVLALLPKPITVSALAQALADVTVAPGRPA